MSEPIITTKELNEVEKDLKNMNVQLRNKQELRSIARAVHLMDKRKAWQVGRDLSDGKKVDPVQAKAARVINWRLMFKNKSLHKDNDFGLV